MRTPHLRRLLDAILIGGAAGSVSALFVFAASIVIRADPVPSVWVLAVVAPVVAIGWLLRGDIRSSQREIAASLRQVETAVQRGTRQLTGVVELARLGDPYPIAFGSGFALDADSAVILSQEVMRSRPGRVVELGSGVSTLMVGALLREQGSARLISVEQDGSWATRTRAHIEAMGLSGFVEVMEAPLVPLELHGERYAWYDLPMAATAGPIDLLIVDGPSNPPGQGGNARYPAMPVLQAALAPAASIFVDDFGREGERRMVERWRRESAGWTVETYPEAPLCVVLRRGEGLSHR